MHTGSRSPCGNSDPVGLPPVHQAPSQALVQLHLTGNQPAPHPHPVPQRPAGSYGRPGARARTAYRRALMRPARPLEGECALRPAQQFRPREQLQ